MNWNDLIIIYLACGAPLAVYYFLQNRNLPDRKFLSLKTFVRLLFWIPYAIRLVARNRVFTKFYNLDFDRHANSDADAGEKISALQRELEDALGEACPRFSIYEFREIFERYTGLTMELVNENEEIADSEKEIFRITNHENKKLGEICLHRRNRKRLVFHQNLARLDFFDVLTELVRQSPHKQTVCERARQLFALLSDDEAIEILADLSKKSLQTQVVANVSPLENDLWNAEKQNLSPAASQTSTNLQVLTATANSPGTD